MLSRKLVVVVAVSLLSATGLVACAAVKSVFQPEPELNTKECLQRIPLRRGL